MGKGWAQPGSAGLSRSRLAPGRSRDTPRRPNATSSCPRLPPAFSPTLLIFQQPVKVGLAQPAVLYGRRNAETTDCHPRLFRAKGRALCGFVPSEAGAECRSVSNARSVRLGSTRSPCCELTVLPAVSNEFPMGRHWETKEMPCFSSNFHPPTLASTGDSCLEQLLL